MTFSCFTVVPCFLEILMFTRFSNKVFKDSGFVYNERRSGKSSRSEAYQGVEAPGAIAPKTGSNPLGKHPQSTEKEENSDSDNPFLKF